MTDLKHIDTPEAAREAREFLGLTRAELTTLLRLRTRETVRRIEDGLNGRGVPGPYQIALEALCDGFRPTGVELKIDKDPRK